MQLGAGWEWEEDRGTSSSWSLEWLHSTQEMCRSWSSEKATEFSFLISEHYWFNSPLLVSWQRLILPLLHNTEKIRLCMLCCFSHVDFLHLYGLGSLPGSLVHRFLQERILVVAVSFSRRLPDPRIEHVSYISALQPDSLLKRLPSPGGASLSSWLDAHTSEQMKNNCRLKHTPSCSPRGSLLDCP